MQNTTTGKIVANNTVDNVKLLAKDMLDILTGISKVKQMSFTDFNDYINDGWDNPKKYISDYGKHYAIHTHSDTNKHIYRNILLVAGARRQLYKSSISPEIEKEFHNRVTWLSTVSDLSHEADVMLHCVLSYANACMMGHSVIFSVTTPAGRSTTEIRNDSNDLYINQNNAKRNAKPSEENIKLGEEFLKRVSTVNLKLTKI